MIHTVRTFAGKLRKGLIVSVAAAAVFAASTNIASAYTCSDIREAQQQVDGAKAKLLLNYPGTAVTLLGCAATASNQPQNDQAGAFIACGFVACLVIGFDVCARLADNVINIATADNMVKRAWRESSCY